MRALIYLVGIAIASSPARIMAQGAPDFSALHVKVGDRVYITDATTGVEVNGPLAALTETRLVINGYTFRPGPALTIQRDGDSVWRRRGRIRARGIRLVPGGSGNVRVAGRACPRQQRPDVGCDRRARGLWASRPHDDLPRFVPRFSWLRPIPASVRPRQEGHQPCVRVLRASKTEKR